MVEHTQRRLSLVYSDLVKNMDNQKEQLEALEMTYEYIKKLENGIATVVPELRTGKKEDTDEYLKKIIEGINWVIQVVNGTMELLNGEKEIINKEKVNEIILSLSEFLKDENDLLIAANLDRSMLPFLQMLQGRIRELTGVEEN